VAVIVVLAGKGAPPSSTKTFRPEHPLPAGAGASCQHGGPAGLQKGMMVGMGCRGSAALGVDAVTAQSGVVLVFLVATVPFRQGVVFSSASLVAMVASVLP